MIHCITKYFTYPWIILFLATFIHGCTSEPKYAIQGDLKKWHKIELLFDGPATGEMDSINPFLNYRLDVSFTQNGETVVVPGFYAADGNAAETSGETGDKWMVRFAPNKTGIWHFKVSFKQGDAIAVSDNLDDASSAGFMDGLEGDFKVVDSDKSGMDNRAKGRLNYVGDHYLKFEESDTYFIKLGVDAPENLLAFNDFDVSTNVFGLQKTWEPHKDDYNQDANDLLWKKGKGKNLFGAINYLAEEKLNAFSFLTFNVDGDDRNVFPYRLKVSEDDYTAYANIKENKGAWQTMFHKTRFDISKMEQWERIFEYGDRKGMFLHFKTHETETDHLMDKGTFGVEGKLYYRELIARFGHHLALNWNIGEENNQPIAEVKKVAKYISDLDPYNHHIVVHTFPNEDYRYSELVGDQSALTGASLQLSEPNFKDVHPRVLKWRQKSDATGKPWAISVDEPGQAKIALLPDAENMEHNEARGNALWGTLMAGGYGVEWYFGYDSPNSDLTCQDYRSRNLFWDQNRHAKAFFKNHLPFWEMNPSDNLLTDSGSYCLSKPDEIYAVYLHPRTESTSLKMGNSGNSFSIKWYNPRNGGDLMDGSVKNVKAEGTVALGYPPNEKTKDWVVLLQRQ